MQIDTDVILSRHGCRPERSEGPITEESTMNSYHITTFGCQMNEHDSERIKGMLESLGYEEAASRDVADLILFNTCSVRESADSRLAGHLGDAKRLKLEDPAKMVGVGGCWSQSLKNDLFEQFPFVDVAFGPGQIDGLADFLKTGSIETHGYFQFQGFSANLPAKRESQFQAWLQISQGCNCVCSYCIVPSTRGREKSRSLDEVVGEAKSLAMDGVRQITLLGQNVNSYGRDLPSENRADFADLLSIIDGIVGIERIRFTSPHPKDMHEKVVRAVADLPSVCEHIHLPLQSGSSTLLKTMKRTYNQRRYMDRVAMIREILPDCALSTDVIVGFPGETGADFEQTMKVIDQVGFDSAYTFIYSPRRGTEASQFDDQVAVEIKRERMERLVGLVQQRAKERSQRFVGREMEVIVEGPSRTDDTKLRGRTRHNKTVNFEGCASPGDLVPVEVTAATSTTLTGVEIVSPVLVA